MHYEHLPLLSLVLSIGSKGSQWVAVTHIPVTESQSLSLEQEFTAVRRLETEALRCP